MGERRSPQPLVKPLTFLLTQTRDEPAWPGAVSPLPRVRRVLLLGKLEVTNIVTNGNISKQAAM